MLAICVHLQQLLTEAWKQYYDDTIKKNRRINLNHENVETAAYL